MMRVDLPGDGFAKVKSSLAAGMGITVSDYLSNRNPRISRRVFLLMDARRGVTDLDESMVAWLETSARVPYQVVLTKCDLVPEADLPSTVARVSDFLASTVPGGTNAAQTPMCQPYILGCSSKQKHGVQHIRKAIVHACFADAVDASATVGNSRYNSAFWRKWASGALRSG